jgi:diguanylate cyclase (GGDEF)-like protein
MGYPEMMRDVMDQARREEIRNKKKDLENLTIIDNLTGLYNQRYFHLRLDQEMTRSKLYGSSLSLIFLEIGNSVQDDHKIGNPECHETMKVVSEIISVCLRDTINLSFLYDKEKFAVILPEINKINAADIVRNIQRLIRKEKNGGIHLHAGVAQYDNHERIEELITSADNALAENMKSKTDRKG